MEQTKGYLRLKGKLWGLNNKEAKENQSGTKRWLSLGLQTNKENSLFVQLGDWKNSTLTVKIKGEDMEKTEEFSEQEAIDKVKQLFKDGDCVYINARANVDTYRKAITYFVNQIYIEKEPIDFDSESFEETNELNQTVIVLEKPSNKSVNVGVTTYKGEMIEQELKLTDEDVNDYFVENVKVGDVMRLSISVNRKPNYVEGEVQTERKTLKGKHIGGNTRRTLDKDNPYTEFLDVVDVDLEKTEKQKYDRSEIREALDKAIAIQQSVQNSPKIEKEEVSEDDLPY